MSEELLDVDRVNTYYGSSHILKDVSMSIDQGEFTALLGWNGAGKSTALKSIMGLAPPRSGTITFDGESIDGDEPFEVARRGIGYVPDDRGVFPDLTVEENLRTGLFKGKQRTIPDQVFEYFPILKERLRQKGGSLSGGQQQMLVVARALISDPKLLLIDEPFEGLQPSIVSEFTDILIRINDAGSSILIVEQNAEKTLQMVDYAYIMQRGEIVNEGPANEIKASEEIEKEFSSFE